MAFKSYSTPRPSYKHLIGKEIQLESESGKSSKGHVVSELKGKTRNDLIVVKLLEPLVSPKKIAYPYIVVSTRYGGDLLKKGTETVVNIAVSEAECLDNIPKTADDLKHVTQGTILIK